MQLQHFERIDGLQDRILRMGDFMECSEPREWIALSNRLFDACLAAGMSFDEPNHHDWASAYVCKALVSA